MDTKDNTASADGRARISRTKSKTWFQGQTSFTGQKRHVYEGDGLSNHLVAVFEREDNAALAVAVHNAALKSGGNISLNLIDAIDLLTEAIQINEAAFMACGSIHDRRKTEALQRILGLCGDTLRHVSDSLETLRAEAREGGAA